jgi:hypothetical protein
MYSRQLASLLVLALVALGGAAAAAQTPPPAEEKDCLSENANMKNKMQFFVCLNAKREYCQDHLLKLQTECQPSSVKYAGAYSKYLVVKNKSNQLIDMLIAELKYGDKTPSEKFKQLMVEINTSTQEFDKYVQGTTCEGGSNRFLPLLIPIITAALLDRSRTLMDGWLSGNRNAKEQRAAELSTQRWRSPMEFGASAPLAPPQAPPQVAPPVPDPAQPTGTPPPTDPSKPPGGA